MTCADLNALHKTSDLVIHIAVLPTTAKIKTYQNLTCMYMMSNCSSSLNLSFCSIAVAVAVD